jgi:hypothetical protein
MIPLSELQPDKALKDLIDDNIFIALSPSESRIAEVYRQGERPNTDLGDEFIDVLYNGAIRAMTHPLGAYRGNLAVTLYCKAQSDGTAKFNRIYSMLRQVELLVKGKSSGKYFFTITPNNVITPMSYNSATGYMMMVINIEFHTTE